MVEREGADQLLAVGDVDEAAFLEQADAGAGEAAAVVDVLVAEGEGTIAGDGADERQGRMGGLARVMGGKSGRGSLVCAVVALERVWLPIPWWGRSWL